MKRTVFLLCVLVFSSIGQAFAERGDHYYLVKGGMLWLDADDNPDSMINLGLTYGYGITHRISFELDYDRSISGGAYKRTDPITEEGEYKLWLASANAAYRHILFSSAYLKAKAGLTYGNESRSSDAQSDEDDALKGVSASLGLGYAAGPVMGSSTTIELSYIWHKQDITSAMLGVNLTF